MKKKVLIIISLIIGLWIGFEIYKMTKLPSSGYYIIDFENTEEELSEEEKDALVKLLGKLLDWEEYTIEEPYFIEFEQLIYQGSAQNDGVYYMVFKANLEPKRDNLLRVGDTLIYRGEETYEYICRHICFNSSSCEEYKTIREIVKNHYKWWEEHEENLYNVIVEKEGWH